MTSRNATRRSNEEKRRSFFGIAERKPAARSRRRLFVEPLEDRRLLAVAPNLAGAAPNLVVTFTDSASAPQDNVLALRFNGAGELEYSVNGGAFSNDLDPAAAVQSATIADIDSIVTSFDPGNDTLVVNLQQYSFFAILGPGLLDTNETDFSLNTSSDSVVVRATGAEVIHFTGVGGDDDLDVGSGRGDSLARVQNAATANADEYTSTDLPARVEFSGIDRFSYSGFFGGTQVVTYATRNLQGANTYQNVLNPSDTLVIEGADGLNDSFTMTHPSAGLLSAKDNLSNVTVNSNFAAGGAGRIEFHGLNGDDLLTVDVGTADVISVPITFDGGSGSDRLVVTGTPATAVDEVVYTPGPATTEGRLVYESAANARLMTIDFANLEPVVDLVPAATLTVNGTNADNAINYTQGSVVANGLVSVDNFETIEFSNKTTLVINGLAGSDTINLANPNTPTGLTGDADGNGLNGIQPILINAGEPGATDVLIITGTPNGESFEFAQGDRSDEGALVLPGADAAFAGIEAVTIDGRSTTADDTLIVRTGIGRDIVTLAPGENVDAGVFHISSIIKPESAPPLTFRALGAESFIQLLSSTLGDAEDIFEYLGTAVSDTFSVLAANGGTITLGVRKEVRVPGANQLILRGLEGDDTFNIPGNHPFVRGIFVDGGDPSASDFLTVTANTATIDFAANQITIPGAGTVSLAGVERLRLDGTVGAGDGFQVLNYGLPTDVKLLELFEANQAAIRTGDPPNIAVDTLRFFPYTNRSARMERVEGGPVIEILQFNPDSAVNVGAATLGADDRLEVFGGQDGDRFRVFRTQPAPGDAVRVETTLATGTGDETAGVPIIFQTSVESLALIGRSGSDTFVIDEVNGLLGGLSNPPGPSSTILRSGIIVDGGDGSDRLEFAGTSAVTATHSPGPIPGEGFVTHANATNAQLVHFYNLEPVFDPVPGALIVNANNADNAINYTQGSVAANGLVSIDAQETVEFTNKTSLTINGLAGSDAFNLNNPGTPTGLTGITVNGGDPTGSDSVIVNGTTGADTINVSPTGADAGTVQVNALSLVTLQTVESLTINGNGATDALTVVSPSGQDVIEVTPGALADEGTISMRQALAFGGARRLPIVFTNLNANGSLTLADADGVRIDASTVNGTTGDNLFGVSSAGVVELGTLGTGGNVRTLVGVATPGIAFLNVHGLAGDDEFVVAGDHPFIGGVLISGGEPSASDVLTFVGTGAAVTVDLAAEVVGQAGMAPVSFTGVEVLNVFAGVGDINVNGRNTAESIAATPTGAGTATIVPSGLNLTINTVNSGPLNVNAASGSDNLAVYGTQSGETITVNGTLVTVGALKTINYSSTENLQVFGQAGDDTFNVTPSATTTMFIDGGDPIGTTAGDKLNIVGAPHTFEPGPESDEGGFVFAAAQRVSFDHIEAIGPIVGAPCVIVLGTNGDDDITIIARDDSYDPLANGIQDFTVSVNGGPEILYIDTLQLYIDGLAGDDDVVLRTPAPNGAVWDVDVFVAGGTPSAVTGDQGDVFELETPGTQTVTYTPTGSDSGVIDVVTLSSVITLGTFTNACPSPAGNDGYNSSAGGVEQFVYDGEAGNDGFTIIGTLQADTITHTPGGANDEGSFRVNSLLGVSYQNLGNNATLTVNGEDGADTLIVRGTDGNDTFSVAGGTGAVSLNSRLILNQVDVQNLTLDGLNGDDTFNITDNHGYSSVHVQGGSPSGSDSLIVNSPTATIDFATNEITFPAGGPIDISGVERVRLDGTVGAGDGFEVLNYGLPTDVGLLELFEANQAAIRTGDPPNVAADTVRFYPYTNRSARMERAEGGPIIDILQFNPDAAVNVGAATQGADDRLEVIGGHDGDRFRVFRTQPAPGDAVRVETTLAIGTVDQTNGVPIIFQTSVESLALIGRSGADTFLIDEVNGLLGGLSNPPGPSSTILRSGIILDGGDGSDRLEFAGTATVAATYSPGPLPGEGLVTHAIDSNSQLVHFYNLEPVFDPVPGSLAVNGNNADNAINYTQGSSTANGLVSVDAFETIEFSNKTDLTINGLAGSDTVNLNNASTPTDLTSITVNGGDPTGSDTVIVNGTVGLNTVTIAPTAVDAATITGLGATINVATAEHLTYHGQGGDDSLTYTTPAGRDVIFLTDANDLADAGDITGRRSAGLGGSNFLPIHFQNLGAAGSLAFTDADPVRVDQLTINARTNGNASDEFNVDAAGAVILNELNTGLADQQMVNVTTAGIVDLNLNSFGGDDEFNIVGNHPFAGGIQVNGGELSSSDEVNFVGTGGAITGSYGDGTIQEAGFGIVSLVGIELLNIDAAGGNLTALGTAGDETLDLTITGTNSGSATSSVPASPLTTFANVGTLSVDLLGGDNVLRLHYTSDPETIIVNGPAGTVAATNDATATALETVNFTNVDSLRVFGNEGNDAFTVTPTVGLPIFIDGGDPIGTIPGDSLHVNGAIGFVAAGPENDEGGYLTPGETVSFDHIESQSVNPVDGCPFLIVGTNADDDITIIARDASYIIPPAAVPAGLDGAQDFTFSINGGPNVLVIDAPDLYIDSGNGDDDIVIRAPANDIPWDVNVRIAGGPPSIGDPNEADRVVLETPGLDAIVFNPTGPDTANIVVDEDLSGAYEAAGADSLLTLGSFIFVCDEFTYVSSPGGVELVQYDGEFFGPGTADRITINNNTSFDSVTTVDAGSTGVGSYVSGFSPLFQFRFFEELTLNSTLGARDIVTINGTDGADTVTSDADTIDFTGGAALTLGANIEQVTINTFDGNDTVTLSLGLPGTLKVVDAGAGNDSINVSAMSDATIFGGLGDDVIVGSPLADLIYGGSGNDTINGGGGNDQIYGDEGNDTLDGDAGADQMFGGDGSDLFIWDPGDGSDLIEGGANESDVLRFNGSGGAEIFTLNAVGTRLELLRNVGSVDMDVAGVEDIVLNMLGGADALTVNDLAQTDVRSIVVDLGAADAAADTITVNGRAVSDAVDIASPAAGAVNVIGLAYDVRLTSSEAADALTFNGNGGNDTVVSSDDLNGVIAVTINGGSGDDFISGFGTLNGDAGNDTLIGGGFAQSISGGDGNDFIAGGAGADNLSGNAGEDTFVPGFDGASDTIDGGVGFDTILVQGTSANDRIDAIQDSATQIRYEVSGIAGEGVVGGAGTETDTLASGTVEELKIVAGSGDDIIRVAHADALVATPAVTLRFTVDGGSPGASDRLTVTDLGLGDTTIHRIGGIAGNGSYTVGPLAPVIYTDVEFASLNPINSITGGTGGDGLGRLFVFKHDPLEENNSRLNATFLGANDAINLDPVIDPGSDTLFGLPGDEDWYRVVAETTGTLDFQVYFRQQGPLANGRAGLPGNGDLQLEAFDLDGSPIVGFGDNESLATDVDERIRIPVVAGQTYFFRIRGEAGAINVYNVSAVNQAGPTPYGLELDDQPVGDPPPANSDTGRSQFDNITRDNTPTLVLRLDDAFFLQDLPGNPAPDSPPDEVIPIPFRAGPGQPAAPGYAIAIFDEGPNPNPGGGAPQVPLGFATQTSPGVYQFTTPVLVDGSHFLSARVQMLDPASPLQTGFTARSALLEIVVDTVIPPVSFGEPGIPDDGLISDSDTGLNPTNPDTLIDRVTRDTTPTFWGRAEADAIIRVYADVNGNGTLEVGTDVFLGQDTAIPLDGTNQEPDGFWKIESVVNLNDPNFFPDPDGQRTIFVTAEDVAGNVNSPGPGAADTLEIFIDTQGPQITDVEINNVGNPYDLFDPKPSNDGPTPLVQSIVLSIQDLPERTADFLINAIKDDIADNPGHYLLTGDYNGIIPIQDVIVTLLAPVADEPARATIELVFWDFGGDGTPFTLDDLGAPLRDDRYTLFVNDEGIIDRAGNILDGESNADEPHDQDALDPEILGVDGIPTGDGLPGGDFIARFTIDSVAEVGTWGAGSAWIDTNGNTSFDPTNEDFTNRDITYILGITSDDLFAGNFALDAADTADGFDKLAAYGRVNGVWRWIVDTDNDGVPNVNQPDPRGINGLPVAGNFDGDANNGDEVGIFTGTTWWFDTDHDFQVDTSLVVAANFVGYPVVGDFDGDGLDDLAAWTDDRFKFDLAADGLDGAIDTQFRFGFPGANERPVAADVNGDGIDDIGLFVPNRASAAPDEAAEWYILVSGEVQNNGDLRPGDVVPQDTLGPTILDRIVIDPIDGQQIVRFTPVPFGRDLYQHYGDEFSLPIIGNFDPPVTPASADDLPSSGNNTRDPLDVNNDGQVSPIDALLVINHLNRNGSTAVVQGVFAKAPFLDVNNNGQIAASDALAVINHLNAAAISANSGAEGEADQFFSELESGDDGVLAMLADDLETQRRKR